MQVQTKAIIITAIGICSLFFLSSVEASQYTISASSSHQFNQVSHRFSDKRHKRHYGKSSNRHKRDKIGALIGGVIIGTVIANNLSHSSSRHKTYRRYDNVHRHTKHCNHRSSRHYDNRDHYYHDRKRYHRDKNYTGYKGYRDYGHHNQHNQHNQSKTRHGSGSFSSKTYAPSYELRRDHNDRLSCYRVKMYRKGEKVLERVDRDYCGW